MVVRWQGQQMQHTSTSITIFKNECLQRPETSEERSKNSKTEMVSIIANLPPLLVTTPVHVRNKN